MTATVTRDMRATVLAETLTRAAAHIREYGRQAQDYCPIGREDDPHAPCDPVGAINVAVYGTPWPDRFINPMSRVAKHALAAHLDLPIADYPGGCGGQRTEALLGEALGSWADEQPTEGLLAAMERCAQRIAGGWRP